MDTRNRGTRASGIERLASSAASTLPRACKLLPTRRAIRLALGSNAGDQENSSPTRTPESSIEAARAEQKARRDWQRTAIELGELFTECKPLRAKPLRYSGGKMLTESGPGILAAPPNPLMEGRNRETGARIVGAAERLTATAGVEYNQFTRDENGRVVYRHTGLTEIHWEDTETGASRKFNHLTRDENGQLVQEDAGNGTSRKFNHLTRDENGQLVQEDAGNGTSRREPERHGQRTIHHEVRGVLFVDETSTDVYEDQIELVPAIENPKPPAWEPI